MSQKFVYSFVCLLLFALLPPATLPAETVMAWVDGPEMSQRALLLSAIEAGFMDRLFEEGHIVFSAGLVEDEYDNDMQRQYVATRMAREGGARILVLVTTGFTTTEPGTVAFTALDVSEGLVLDQEEVEVPLDSSMSPDERAYEAGAEVADLVLTESVGTSSW